MKWTCNFEINRTYVYIYIWYLVYRTVISCVAFLGWSGHQHQWTKKVSSDCHLLVQENGKVTGGRDQKNTPYLTRKMPLWRYTARHLEFWENAFNLPPCCQNYKDGQLMLTCIVAVANSNLLPRFKPKTINPALLNDEGWTINKAPAIFLWDGGFGHCGEGGGHGYLACWLSTTSDLQIGSNPNDSIGRSTQHFFKLFVAFLGWVPQL